MNSAFDAQNPLGTGAQMGESVPVGTQAIFANRALRRIVASMRVREMRKLVQLRGVTLDPKARRLGACYDVFDLRRAAKRRIPRPVFDYVDGAADEEIAVAANTAAFRSWRFLPRVLAGVASADTSAPLFGASLPVPLLLGPVGYTRMLHPDGEIGAARSALRHGLPYTLSTMAPTGIEELRAAVTPACLCPALPLYPALPPAAPAAGQDKAPARTCGFSCT